MTARIIRRGLGHHHWRHEVWRVVLALAALLAAWLLLSSAAAAAPPVPLPSFPKNFDPAKFVENFLPTAAKNKATADRLAKVEITWDEEVALGQRLWNDLQQRFAAQKVTLTTRGREIHYLQKLISLIQPHLLQADRYRRLDIAIAKSDVPNACALPGGRLIVTRGMLDQAGCEAALVCVLGHELAHLDRGHLLRRVQQWKLAQSEFAQAPAEFSFDALASKFDLMQQLFRQPFGPDEELEADQDGITWAYRLGYDPRTVEQVYLAMENAGLTAPAFLPTFLRTHPLTADRREHLRTTYANLQAAQPNPRLYLGRQNLTRKITRQDQEFAE
jgi:predicted Zn-dependent protease